MSSANDQSVRRALTPLANLAERHRCVILMIRHPNKSGGSMSLGLADRTLSRAKRELKIRSVRIYVDEHPIYYWLLPEQALPDNVPPDSVPPSLEPWLKPIREKYSGRGPSVA